MIHQRGENCEANVFEKVRVDVIRLLDQKHGKSMLSYIGAQMTVSV